MKFSNRFRMTACVLALVGCAAIPAKAQVPAAPPPPYNSDIGAVLTNTLRTAGTVNSANQNNIAWQGVKCTYNAASESGSPSTTFAIQQFDAASASWFTLVTSGAITQLSTPTPIEVRPGIQTASLPAGYVAVGVGLPRVWRVTQTVGGSGGPAVTGTIGCNYTK